MATPYRARMHLFQQRLSSRERYQAANMCLPRPKTSSLLARKEPRSYSNEWMHGGTLRIQGGRTALHDWVTVGPDKKHIDVHIEHSVHTVLLVHGILEYVLPEVLSDPLGPRRSPSTELSPNLCGITNNLLYPCRFSGRRRFPQSSPIRLE